MTLPTPKDPVPAEFGENCCILHGNGMHEKPERNTDPRLNWLSGESAAAAQFYREHYSVVFDAELSSGNRIMIKDPPGAHGRHCRFCGRSNPGVSFRNEAHAIPEFLGNKDIISWDECDECNELFAREYEDHLAKWFGPLRTISQMHGKKGVPTYKDKIDNEAIRIEMGQNGLRFTITAAHLRGSLDKEGPFSFTLPVDTPSQSFIPMRAAMALVKIACSVCPSPLLPFVRPAIDWLLGRAQAKMRGFPVLYAFTPGPNPYLVGKVLLLRRKSKAALPYLWGIIASTNHRFQFFVPFCPEDKWIENGRKTSFTCHHFPVPFGIDWKYGKTEYHLFDWSCTAPVTKNPRVTLNVDRAERLK